MARATLVSKPRLIRQVAASVISAACVLAYGAMSPLLAQQQAPPPWTQGRPPEQASSPLAPHAQPPAPKPAKDIPVDKVKLPPGFKIEVWADMLPNARSMTLGNKGTLFVGSRGAGNVYAVVDKGGIREGKVIAKGLQQPNGMAFRDGTLYVAEISRTLRNVPSSMYGRGSPLENDAIRIAARIPGARVGTVEIRPVMEIAGRPMRVRDGPMP